MFRMIKLIVFSRLREEDRKQALELEIPRSMTN